MDESYHHNPISMSSKVSTDINATMQIRSGAYIGWCNGRCESTREVLADLGKIVSKNR